MGKALTPDVEDANDIERFCIGGWFPRGDRVVKVRGVDNQHVVLTLASGRNQTISFQDFLDEVRLGVPENTYIVQDGALQYVRVNIVGQRSQGVQIRDCRWEGFPTCDRLKDNADTAQQIWFPEYTRYADAIRMLAGGEVIGVALSANIGLISPEVGPTNITYQGDVIGTLDDGNINIHNKYKYLRELVMSVCK
jgi:hypothetical protein